MKRTLASALILGVCSLGLVGCGEESKVEKKETVSTPEGATTTTKSEKVESSGTNPPPSTSGETAKTPEPAPVK
jgi:cell division septation protein DedD